MVTENDPAVAFNWSTHLNNAVEMVNEAQPILPRWVPKGTHYPLTVEQVKALILNRCQMGVTTGGIVDSFVIAPNSGIEASRMSGRLAELSLDPFIIALANHCGDYVARIHYFGDSGPRMTSEPLNLLRPHQLAEGDAQAFV